MPPPAPPGPAARRARTFFRASTPSRHPALAGGLACLLTCFLAIPPLAQATAQADVLLPELSASGPGPLLGRLPALAAAERGPFLATLEELVNIESGSQDLEGLDRIATVVAARLEAVGAAVEVIEPGSEASPEIYRMADTPARLGKMVKASLRGSGKARILLIAHMDTVYPRGSLARQPFRLEGDRAYGLGIADDKQGIAVILHGLSLLGQLSFRDYDELTVLINGDEEISSPGSRALITRLAADHDVVMSYEGAPVREDKLSLATAGIGAVHLQVTGRASHAGASPEQGVNALYELAHQVLQARDLSDPATGVKLNWTVARAGSTRNVIPDQASASADVRVMKVADFDTIERRVGQRVASQLLPDARVTMTFERRRPPLEATAPSLALARHAQAIYQSLGLTLGADDKVSGGGTDAAFAGLGNPATAVVERFGLQGFGAHSADAEYVLLSSIEPRLQLLVRMVIDLSAGRVDLSPGKGR